jgi:dienelactone hydrolase
MALRFFAIAAVLAALSAVGEAESIDELASPLDYSDLKFPDQPQPVESGRKSMMFKPDGSGPFPALVIMPTCYAHLHSKNTFDWAERALTRGYAALVIDPLAPRGLDDNCRRPLRVPASRILKDAFDGADHLRRRPFIDPARIGLLGFSQGAMVGLGAAGQTYYQLGGRRPFNAVVSVYPVCRFEKFPMRGISDPVNINYVPEKVVVPLLVEIGDQDTQGGPPMNGCKTLLAERKAQGDPVEFIVYHATHVWDHRELGAEGEHTQGVYGQDILYQFDAGVTEQSAKDAFAFFDEHMKGR